MDQEFIFIWKNGLGIYFYRKDGLGKMDQELIFFRENGLGIFFLKEKWITQEFSFLEKMDKEFFFFFFKKNELGKMVGNLF